MVKVLSITWPINITLEEQLYKNGLLLTRCMDQMHLSVVTEMQAIPVNLKPCVLRKLSLATAVLWIQEQNIKFIQVFQNHGLGCIMPIENLRITIQSGRSIWQKQGGKPPLKNAKKSLHIVLNTIVIIRVQPYSMMFLIAKCILG